MPLHFHNIPGTLFQQFPACFRMGCSPLKVCMERGRPMVLGTAGFSLPAGTRWRDLQTEWALQSYRSRVTKPPGPLAPQACLAEPLLSLQPCGFCFYDEKLRFFSPAKWIAPCPSRAEFILLLLFPSQRGPCSLEGKDQCGLNGLALQEKCRLRFYR